MLVARIIFVALSLLLLANCARQIDPAKYALAERDTPVHSTSNKRHFANPDTDYDGIAFRAVADVPKVDIGKPTGGDIRLSRKDIHEKRIDAEKSDAGIGSHTVGAAVTVVQPANTSSRAKNAKFLETLAKDDEENQLLQLKTNICRGC
jgi:hypothetical protein